MLTRVFSGAVYGVDAYPVEIEINAARGDPSVVIVGLPDTAVKESKDRVRTAMANSGFRPHVGRTTINLAPADIKKEGPSFDLPIAVGMIATSDEIDIHGLERFAMAGELALSGEVRRVRGILPIALKARSVGLQGIIVPSENAEEAAVVSGLDVYPVRTLRQAVDFLAGELPQPPFRVNIDELYNTLARHDHDFAEVKGQESAKRAVEVAVAGGHNILMIGSPGTGKTMLAKRIVSILPEMVLDEALESTKIHSIAGTLPPHRAVTVKRAFRSPHHTISDAGLLGGGTHPMPGEVSLAHHGVLFLDELPEFHRNVLEVLRQPLEDRIVTISRASGTVTFPCDFMLVAAMNPCPCGYYGDLKKECRCNERQISNYRNRISGPLLDRIDIHIEVPTIGYSELSSLSNGEGSSSIRQRVVAARAIQHDRFSNRSMHQHQRSPLVTRPTEATCNAGMGPKELEKYCSLKPDAEDVLRLAIEQFNFSARAYDRIRKVARTIADLKGSKEILPLHVTEAIQYRTLDRQLWQ